MDFPSEILPGRYLFGRKSLISQCILPILRKRKPAVVIAQFSLGVVTFWKLLLLRPFFGYKLIPWSHGIRNLDMVLAERSGHFRIAPRVYKMADATLFYSHARRDLVVRNTPRLAHKCFVAANTLDTRRLKAAYERHAAGRPDDSFTILYLGRMRASKRIDLVLDAYTLLARKYKVRLVCIGDGEERARLERIQDPNIIVTGAIHDIDESAPLLAVAHIMLMPGYVGLGIVHGFAFGLPMITCRSTVQGPFHSPEIEYLKDGENGFFCESNAEDIAAHIEKLILDPALLARMCRNALKTVANEANIDRMIEGFREAIDFVTNDKMTR